MFKKIANIDSFLSDRDYSTNVIPESECRRDNSVKKNSESSKARLVPVLCSVIVIGLITGSICYKRLTTLDSASSLFGGIFNENILNEVLPETSAISATSTKREVISVPRKITKADPFMPYRDVSVSFNAPPKFELLEPPEYANEGSDAARVMETSVSGILYDVYCPSAILNIEGIDHLVKKGDKVSNYEVLNIDRNTVTVKLGANIYRSGIGEILTSNEIHYNKVSNLDKKFGGKNGN